MLMELWKRALRLDETSIFGFLKIFEIQAGVAQMGPKGGGVSDIAWKKKWRFRSRGVRKKKLPGGIL